MRSLNLAVLAVLALTACGMDSNSPTGVVLPKVPVPDFTTPTARIVSLDPPQGSTLHSGQTLTAEVEFSFPSAEYPLRADITFWTVIPNYPGWHNFGEGRGCAATEYKTFAYSHTVRCEVFIHPIIWGWWQEDGVKSVVLAFAATNAQHYNGISEYLMYKEFPINYQVP